MVAGAALPEDLTDAQWLCELEEIGEEAGYFSRLGDDHAAIFVDRSQSVLFVAFETVASARMGSESGLPLAFGVCEDADWSHLTLLATNESWFRDCHVYRYFDRLVDESFFEDFDTVIFYGAGMGGYAAAAYSVAAPCATVILVSPQATLERSRTDWDDRFPTTRRMDFTSRYGYAPDMLEAAYAAYVFYDPDEVEDAMHASLFRGPNIQRVHYRRGRSGAIDGDFRALGLISRMVKAAASDHLNPLEMARLLRARRRHIPYLRALLSRVMAEDRPYLAAMLCQAVLRYHDIPRFREYLNVVTRQLNEDRRPLPGRQLSTTSSSSF